MIIEKEHKRGRRSQILTDILHDCDSTMSIKLSTIVTDDKVFIFNYPVLFQIYQEGKGTIIENELLDIFAAGGSVIEAKNELYHQFEHTYNRFQELNDSQLSPHLLEAKRYIQFIIKSIINR